jgi:hypothetical protein
VPQTILPPISCPTAQLATTGAIDVTAVRKSARVGLPAATPPGASVALFSAQDSSIAPATLPSANAAPPSCLWIATLVANVLPTAQAIVVDDARWGPYLVIARLDALGGAVHLVVVPLELLADAPEPVVVFAPPPQQARAAPRMHKHRMVATRRRSMTLPRGDARS